MISAFQSPGARVESRRTGVAGPGFDSAAGFLLHISDGDGANGKWLMWSDAADWQGDYLAAGVTGIRLDADNRAGSPLGLRIAFDGPGGWFVSDAQTITNSTAGEDWTELSFSLVASNFSHVGAGGGSGSFNATMSAVTRFEILGGPDSFTYRPGPDIIDAGISTNTVAIDGITAVPEPSALALLAAPLIALRRRR